MVEDAVDDYCALYGMKEVVDVVAEDRQDQVNVD